jgi:glutathione peroxidase-family protein
MRDDVDQLTEPIVDQRLYHERGLEVLGFPCDQFGHQEPGGEAEIKKFCSLSYGVSFPMFGKDGVPIKRYAPADKAERIEPDIEAVLH